MAFPGRESQFLGLDRDSISPKYIPVTSVIGVGSPAGARRGEGGDGQPVPDAVPGRCRDPNAACGRST